jgi:hypothetical protein
MANLRVEAAGTVAENREVRVTVEEEPEQAMVKAIF